MSTKQEALMTIVSILEKSVKESQKASFNQLRRANPKISMTAENFFMAIQDSGVNHKLKLTPVKGKIDPSVITDLEVETATSG